MACENSELTAIEHFIVDNKMVEIGSGAKRKPKDYNITRYACYIIAQNEKKIMLILKRKLVILIIKLKKQLEKLLKKQGRTMPENLSTPTKSLKQLEKEKIK